MRAGERPFLMTEEFGFEQLGRNRGAVDLHERTGTAPRRGMDGPCDKVLPHAAFAPDQDRCIGVCDVLDNCPDRPHPRASVEQWVVGVGETMLLNILLYQRPVR